MHCANNRKLSIFHTVLHCYAHRARPNTLSAGSLLQIATNHSQLYKDEDHSQHRQPAPGCEAVNATHRTRALISVRGTLHHVTDVVCLTGIGGGVLYFLGYTDTDPT